MNQSLTDKLASQQTIEKDERNASQLQEVTRLSLLLTESDDTKRQLSEQVKTQQITLDDAERKAASGVQTCNQLRTLLLDRNSANSALEDQLSIQQSIAEEAEQKVLQTNAELQTC